MTAKQKRFAEEYIIDLNATRAATRAGYSKHTARSQASRLLKNVYIQAQISYEMDMRSERTGITKDKILREMARIGFVNIGDIIDNASGGVLQNVSEDDLAAIAVIKTRTFRSHKGQVIIERMVRLHNKQRALDMMARYLGMFSRKVDVRMEVPVRIVNNTPRVLPDADD